MEAPGVHEVVERAGAQIRFQEGLLAGPTRIFAQTDQAAVGVKFVERMFLGHVKMVEGFADALFVGQAQADCFDFADFHWLTPKSGAAGLQTGRR